LYGLSISSLHQIPLAAVQLFVLTEGNNYKTILRINVIIMINNNIIIRGLHLLSSQRKLRS